MIARFLFSATENAALRRLYVVLAVINAGAWSWAFYALHTPALFSTAVIAYGFGLRHAMDADHIAAIDNVTRKLMSENRPSSYVGFFFALGHSAVVLLGVVGVALITRFSQQNEIIHETGVVAVAISSGFLLLIGLINLFILRNMVIRRKDRKAPMRGRADDDINGGLFSRFLKPILSRVRSARMMIPLGFLFGLGFETATEIAILSGASVHASLGMSLTDILVFPCMFGAGMMLMDSANGTVMMGAYKWALNAPDRRYHYNMIITAVSAGIALFIGSIQTLSLVSETWSLAGPFWDAIEVVHEHMSSLGFYMIGIAVVCWGVSAYLHKQQNKSSESLLA